MGRGEWAETDGPTFEEDDFYGGRRVCVDAFPGCGGDAVAFAGEGGLVILRYTSWFIPGEGGEDGEGERDVMG